MSLATSWASGQLLAASPKENQSIPTTREGGLMNNRRVQALVRQMKLRLCCRFCIVQFGRVLANPAVLQDMAREIGMATGSAAMMRE